MDRNKRCLKDMFRKKGTSKDLTMGVLFFLLLIFPVCTKVYALTSDREKMEASEKTIRENQKKINALNEEIKKLDNDVKDFRGDREELNAGIEKLDMEMSEVNKAIERISLETEGKLDEIENTEALIEETAVRKEKQYEMMKQRIRFMYEKGQKEAIELIFSSGSWTDLLNRTEYIRRVSKADRDRLLEYKETEEAYIRLSESLNREKEELDRLNKEETEKKKSIDSLIEEKKEKISEYDRKISETEKLTDRAEENIDELKKEIERQESVIRNIEKKIKEQEEAEKKKAEENGETYEERTLSGGLIWPCPSSQRVTSAFGDRSSPTEGASSNHKGIDIGANSGSKVVAAAEGQVVIATYSKSAGNYVMINHGSGVYTVYMHMLALSVSEGEEVSQGQQIGAVGSTGYSTGPHLHFGVRKNGNYVDPLSYVG